MLPRGMNQTICNASQRLSNVFDVTLYPFQFQQPEAAPPRETSNEVVRALVSRDPVNSAESQGDARQSEQKSKSLLLNRFALSLAFKRSIIFLSDMRVAIGELAAILGMCAISTVVEQNQSKDFYEQVFPDGSLLSHNVIYFLQLDHVYSSVPFLGLLAIFGLSLASCTSTNQLPAFRRAQRWNFRSDFQSLSLLPVAFRIPSASLKHVGEELARSGYQVFSRDGRMYAFKGIVGKLAPIGVHVSMLAVMLGISIGAVSGSDGQVFISEGSSIKIFSALHRRSPLYLAPTAATMALRLDGFDIDFRVDGSVRQFHSDVSITDSSGSNEFYHKRLGVNNPLRFGGVTVYQIDWKLSSLILSAGALEPRDTRYFASNSNPEDSEETYRKLPLKELPDKSYATFLPVAHKYGDSTSSKVRGITLIAEDPEVVRIYDSSGRFAGAQRPGSKTVTIVDGMSLKIISVQSSSGLQLKSDPGVPWVYVGFVGVCTTTILSYASHSQVWAVEENEDVLIGGKSNRSKILFAKEIERLAESIPIDL